MLLFLLFGFALSGVGQKIIVSAGAGRQTYAKEVCNFVYGDGRLMFSRPFGYGYRVGPWINYVFVDFKRNGYVFEGSYSIFGVSLDKVWERNADDWQSPEYRNTYVWINSGLRLGSAKDADNENWRSWEKSRSLSFSAGMRIIKPMFDWFKNSETVLEMEFPLRSEKRFSTRPGVIAVAASEKKYVFVKLTYENGASFVLPIWQGIKIQPIVHLGVEYRSAASMQYGIGVRLGRNRNYQEPVKAVFFRDSKGSNNVAINLNFNIN